MYSNPPPCLSARRAVSKRLEPIPNSNGSPKPEPQHPKQRRSPSKNHSHHADRDQMQAQVANFRATSSWMNVVHMDDEAIQSPEHLNHRVADDVLEVVSEGSIEALFVEGSLPQKRRSFRDKERTVVENIAKGVVTNNKPMKKIAVQPVQLVNPQWERIPYATPQHADLFVHIPLSLFPSSHETVGLYIASNAFDVDTQPLASGPITATADDIATDPQAEGFAEVFSWWDIRHPAAGSRMTPPPPVTRASILRSAPRTHDDEHSGPLTINLLHIPMPSWWFHAVDKLHGGLSVRLRCHCGVWSSLVLQKLILVKSESVSLKRLRACSSRLAARRSKSRTKNVALHGQHAAADPLGWVPQAAEERLATARPLAPPPPPASPPPRPHLRCEARPVSLKGVFVAEPVEPRAYSVTAPFHTSTPTRKQ